MSTEIPTEAEIAELRRNIVRATSWDQLFVSLKQEKADYEKCLVGEVVAEYKGNGSLKNHTVRPDPNGDIHVLERVDPGYFSTYQKLHQGRDVIITFYDPNKQSSSTVTCDVGNINHRFSRTNTFIPDYDSLRQIGDNTIQEITGTDIANLHSYSGGKPATKLWEEMMLNSYNMPQRIGHRIFPHFVLEAQAKLMVAYPRLFLPLEPLSNLVG